MRTRGSSMGLFGAIKESSWLLRGSGWLFRRNFERNAVPGPSPDQPPNTQGDSPESAACLEVDSDFGGWLESPCCWISRGAQNGSTAGGNLGFFSGLFCSLRSCRPLAAADISFGREGNRAEPRRIRPAGPKDLRTRVPRGQGNSRPMTQGQRVGWRAGPAYGHIGSGKAVSLWLRLRVRGASTVRLGTGGLCKHSGGPVPSCGALGG